MAKQVETIWDYLESIGYEVTRRPEKKTVHLALESEKLNNAQLKRMNPIMDWSEKLDGVYSLVTVIQRQGINDTVVNEVRHWGRSGKAQVNLDVLDGLVADSNLKFPKESKGGLILISEVTSDDALAKLSGYVNPNRVKGSSFVPTNLSDNFHDLLTVREFINGTSKGDYVVRADRLVHLLEDTSLPLVPYFGYMTLEEAKVAVKPIWKRGGEGFVGRDAHALWTAGTRNETVIKLKEKLSYDVTVIGICSGKKGSKYEHTAGKLLVAFRAFGEPDGEFIVVPISGMTDSQRKLWWEHPGHIVGQVVKMDAKSFTENGNLREPRYKETRHDKGSDFPVKVTAKVREFTKAMCEHRVFEWEAM